MFGFPISEKPESLRFASNSLQTATFQLKYHPIDFTSQTDAITELVTPILPKTKGLLKQELILSSHESTPVVTAQGVAKPSGLEFRAKDGGMTFTIRDDSMTLEILGSSYTHFKDAFAYLENTFYKVADLLDIKLFSRIAIRKVNIIGTKKPEEGKHKLNEIVRDVFNSEMTGPAVHLPPSPNLDAFIANCYFVDGFNNLNLTYGLLHRQEDVEDRQLLLDIDVFSVEENTSIEKSKEKFLEINNEVFNVFMWSLTPTVKALLKQ
jgi:uncharacterized protein (TIGR04255 family)